MEYRIIIAGGREFNDYELLKTEALRAIYRAFGKIDKNNVRIISGCAKGADSLGERFAKEYGLAIEKMPANWDKYGKSAGYRRNEQMADFAKAKDENRDDVCGMLIAFWDGESRGTAHMIELSKNKKLLVNVIKY